MNNEINVAWMYPDILNLHGERGNAKAFELVSKKMNVKLNIDRIDNIEEKIDFSKYDILLFNAGELKVINTLSEILNEQKEELIKYINENKIILVTGTTGALFANEIKRINNTSFNGLGILNMDIQERKMIIGDDLYCSFDKLELMGCQIQMMDIVLKDVEPFGKIKYGYGNIGNEFEGAKYKNLMFTNMLGPILVKNPWFTEYLIKLAIKNKKLKIKTKKVNYSIELKSLDSAKEFIDKKMEGQTIH